MPKKITAIRILLYLLLLIYCQWNFSCLNIPKEKHYVIGFSQCTGNDDWRQTMLGEMTRELSFNNNIEFLYRNAEADSKKQIKQIEELVRQHIDLLIVSPNEVQPLSPIIESVYNSGIPVVIVDRRTNTTQYTAFVGASNFEVGQNAGRYSAAVLKGKGSVIEVTGIPDASPVIDRHNGFIDIISHYPGINYLKRFDNYSAQNSKDDRIIKFLKTTGPLDLIYAQNDFMAFDLYKICKQLGIEKKIKIIGTDGLPLKGAGLDMVANKYISATILYPTGGQEAILTALAILKKNPFKKENQLFTTIIDSSNVRIMKLQSEKLISQQKDIEQRQRTIDRQILITKNQSMALIIIIVTLTLALIFGGFSFYYLKENKKINRRLAVQNEEISQQKNLLIEMSAKAEEAHLAKLNFFTNISHEFRTPLTLILAPLGELLENTRIQHETKQMLKLIQKNVMRLYRLVNQLMDFRKIEFKKMKLQVSENDLIGFTGNIVDSYKVLAKTKNIDLQFITSERILNVWFDISMLDKVIFNLLSNAFKFTNDNGFIHVTILRENSHAVIRVEDNGIGMAPEAISHAFEPFFQGEYENYKGTGLGLALSKELIELHHGQIKVQSEKRKGTIFEIFLMSGNSHFEEAEITAGLNKESVIHEDPDFYTIELYNKKINFTENAGHTSDKNLAILIIEDNEEMRDYLVSKLRDDYIIFEAENGNKALQSAFEYRPDLIICDIVIPGRNGLEITQIIKKDVRTSHIPLILLTARDQDAQKVEGMQTEADAYITKPFNLMFLQKTIKSLLANRIKTKDHYSGVIFSEERLQVSKKVDRKFINDFSTLVENNISNEKFGVPDICKELSVSKVQLYRKVNSILNCSVNDYVITTRLQKAKYYMQYENLSISEIAFKTGFSTAAYFSTVFKSKFGITPKSFKENKK